MKVRISRNACNAVSALGTLAMPYPQLGTLAMPYPQLGTLAKPYPPFGTLAKLYPPFGTLAKLYPPPYKFLATISNNQQQCKPICIPKWFGLVCLNSIFKVGGM
jgi:hypothetical protein